MPVFSVKERKLIKYLSQSDFWVSSNEIVSSLGISLRTLRNIVKSINADYKYIISSNKGYKIAKNARVIEELLREEKQTENIKSSNREQMILKELLLSKQPVDYYDLSNALFISEQTLLSVITSLKKKISAYGVTIVRRKDTIALKGDEKNIRSLFFDTVYKEAENSILNISVLNTFFGDIDVLEIKNTVSQIIDDSNFKINDFALNNIILHLCIIIDRKKYEVRQEPFKTDVIFDKDDSQYFCAVQIIQWISDKNRFEASKDDFDVIYALLLICMKGNDFDNSANMDELIEPSIVAFVKKIIIEIYNEFYINLDNEEFISNFSLHLHNVVNRKMSLRNPLLTSIKNSYPTIYEISVFIAKSIQDKYPFINMNDHQISYIALHVGAQIEKQALTKIKTVVINPEYLKLNALILSKLEINFSNDLTITVVSDEIELEKIENKNVDLIITTMPLKGYFECKIVEVTVFISQKDIENVFNAISEIRENRTLENEYLLQYFDGSFCYFDNNAVHYEDVIKKLCETHHDLDDSFFKRVMIREEMSPSEYLNIAVAHPIQCDEENTFITVGIFKKPFRWRNNDINIVFLLSVSQKDKSSFLKILRHLIQMFSSAKWMEYHSSITTYDKFVRFINEYTMYK